LNATLTVLLFSTIAASTAALGVLPLIGRERLPHRWIGWANALAAGLMLGAAYILTEAGMDGPPVPAAAGALRGARFIFWTHKVSHPADLRSDRVRREDPAFEYRVLHTSGLHGASEGVAIGVAMVLDVSFGIFMALAIAVHNVPESTALCATIRTRGVSLIDAGGLALASNVGQILLAVAVYAVVEAAPGALPWALGFAVGALINLVMIELLPESYREAGPTGIALVASVAMSMVVLVKGALP
jgi:ZIP family zinc transporter